MWNSVKRFLFDHVEERSRQEYELNKDDEALLQMLGINKNEVNVRGKNALKTATVYSAIKILSESVAKLPLKVHKEDEHSIHRGTKHYLTKLLRLRPNPLMSTTSFFSALEVQRNLRGNSYASIEYDRKGNVVALWPIDSANVKIYVDDVGLLNTKSKLWYIVNVNGKQHKLLPHEILHFKNSVTLDGLAGVPTIDILKGTIESAASAEQFIRNFYKQGLQAKGIIQYVGDLDEKAKRNFREKFEDMSSGLKNSHRVSLLPVGYQYVPIAMSMNDAQFLENTELSIRQIATAFGIKMHQLNDLSRSTHTNIEQQQRQFYTDTLQAILTMYEQEMTYKLFLDSEINAGYYLKFNVDAILRADSKTRYEAHRIGIQAGFLTPNEARAYEDKPPMEGGDVLLVNGSMTPIQYAGAAYKKKAKGGGEGDEKGNAKDDKGNSDDADEPGST